ncbi:MAG: hypothetical protein AAF968_09685 [Pseudomonadota bacterium]
MSGEPTEICLDCGLCCDGSLFWAVPVDKDDPAPVARDAEGRLRQPCACFEGVCTIYEHRPAACRAFDCRVLLAVMAGQLDREAALSEIAKMRRIVEALDKALPGNDPSVYRRASEFLSANREELPKPAFQRRHRPLLALLSDYEKALARFQIPPGARRKAP